MRGLFVAACALAVVAVLSVSTYMDYRRLHKPQLTTRFQCVTLLDGRVLCGRIDHLGTDHPVLREAFSLRTEPNSQSGERQHIIARLRDGPTGADHVIFPATSIVSVEPVSPASPIGQLLARAAMPQ